MKKEGGLDRFERMVQRKFPRWRKFLKGDPMIGWGQAADLLRNEHAWMRRMVRCLDNVSYANMSDDYQAGMHHAYVSVMQKLEQRRK